MPNSKMSTAGAVAFMVWTLCSSGGVAGTSLLPYRVVGAGIPVPLTTSLGVAETGRELVASRTGGNCLVCHHAPIPEEPDQGRVGPSLDGVGTRLGEAELRLRVVNPKITDPGSMMPAFFRTEGLYRVADPFQGQTILSAQDVEDVVAYLKTLK